MLRIACILLLSIVSTIWFTSGYLYTSKYVQSLSNSASRLYKIPPFRVPSFDFDQQGKGTVQDKVVTPATEKKDRKYESQVASDKKNATMSSAKESNDKKSLNSAPSQDDDEEEDDDDTLTSMPKTPATPTTSRLETRKSRRMAEEWRRQNDPNYIAPMSIYREESGVKEWSLSDSLNINSTTLRALFDLQGEVINFFAKISKGFETITVVIASKVERDLRTVGLSTDYINRRTNKELKKLFGDKDVNPSEVGGKFSLPSSVSTNTSIARMESLQALNPFAPSEKEKKSKLIGGFNKGTTTSERLRKRREKERSVKNIASSVSSKVTLGADGVYRSINVLPKKLSYDYERRKRKQEMEENAWKSRQLVDANIKQIGESVETEAAVLGIEETISPPIDADVDAEEDSERADGMVVEDLDGNVINTNDANTPLIVEDEYANSNAGPAVDLKEVYAFWTKPRNADLLQLFCYVGDIDDCGDGYNSDNENEPMLVMDIINELETDLSFLYSQLNAVSASLASRLSISLASKIDMVIRAQSSRQRLLSACSTAYRLSNFDYELVTEQSLLRLKSSDARYVKDGLWLLGEILTQLKTNSSSLQQKGDEGSGVTTELSSLITHLSSYVLERKDDLLYAFKVLDSLDRSYCDMNGTAILETRRDMVFAEEYGMKEKETVPKVETQVDFSQYVAASAFNDDDDEEDDDKKEIDLNITVDRDTCDQDGALEIQVISTSASSSNTPVDTSVDSMDGATDGEIGMKAIIIDTDADIIDKRDVTETVIAFLLQSFDVTLFLAESLVKAVVPLVTDGGAILARRYSNIYSNEYNVKYITGSKTRSIPTHRTSHLLQMNSKRGEKREENGASGHDDPRAADGIDRRDKGKSTVTKGKWQLLRGVADAKTEL